MKKISEAISRILEAKAMNPGCPYGADIEKAMSKAGFEKVAYTKEELEDTEEMQFVAYPTYNREIWCFFSKREDKHLDISFVGEYNGDTVAEFRKVI